MQSPTTQRYVSFAKIPNARTGNILIQYLFCVYISIKYGHQYLSIEDFQSSFFSYATQASSVSIIKLTDQNLAEFDESVIKSSHIICEGFFQRDEFFVPIRDQILEYLKNTTDYWIGYGGSKESIRDFITSRHSVDLKPADIVISLRLGDFIQLPNSNSDIVPPRFYTDILERWFSTENREDGNLIIVCDKITNTWERKYLEFFNKWSPLLIQNTLEHDCALMRDCKSLIHSNSTLCWLMSFLSEKTHRFIPVTGTYTNQHLEAISPGDVVSFVQPLTHENVFAMNIMLNHRDLRSLPYAIPDEVFVDTPLAISKKSHVVAPIIPGNPSNYLFGAGQESEYYDLYYRSMFANTKKKGGWDCLRHYEILANGCIPIFENLNDCPEDTLVSFPKKLISEALQILQPWTNSPEQQEAYDYYSTRLLEYSRRNCSVSAITSQFLRDMSHLPSPPKRILMLCCDPGVNYTRELLWIGLKRQFGVEAVEWPPMEFLYDSFPAENLGKIYGNGFSYSRRLPAKLLVNMTESEVVESIQKKQWDIIIYGKVGRSETVVGSIPNLPLWKHVFKRYSRDEIAFLYGGDAIQDMTWSNAHANHLVQHSQYARCFVREFLRWKGAHL